MRHLLLFLVIATYIVSPFDNALSESPRRPSNSATTLTQRHGLHFQYLPASWDEGIPLGNGMLGALVWQKDGVLRIALDRADLWDLRPIKEFTLPQFRFSWVTEQVTKAEYKPVQDLFDVPYDRDAAPTKLPAGAMEFPLLKARAIQSVDLRLEDALCVVRWRNGTRLEMFVQADAQQGWFRFDRAPDSLAPTLSPPPFSNPDTSRHAINSGPGGNDLRRLGYPPPEMRTDSNCILYTQECSEGTRFSVSVAWTRTETNALVGSWTITSTAPYPLGSTASLLQPGKVTVQKYNDAYRAHARWWKAYWSQSSVELPDSVLERQWYLELYKFGSTSRRGAPPITLQAVWTADNGRLPPWKGDFHNDLNTQLSYWPCYTANHLEEGLAFLEWLWQCKPASERYTKTFFQTSGLNVPGVATLTGEPMGGWIQYALSPTVSAWLAQHFYLHWRYSMDSTFLKTRAYPWIREVAIHLDELSVRDRDGRRQLPLSSSPEINDNRIDAWFRQTTNFDLALIRWLYAKAEELALALGKRKEAEHWRTVYSEWPDLAVSEKDQKLLIAPGYELNGSHRHFSHLMAIHPLGLLDWSREPDRHMIAASLADLERLGTDWWCGYSYSWLGNLWARAQNGEKAANALRTFATCFCLPNSFHANGDQSHSGKSKFTYRPFTLEGNFAFAAGIQDMLLQSQGGLLRLFPAIPSSWKNVSFSGFRAEGAVLISARMEAGEPDFVVVVAEKRGTIRLFNPFADRKFTVTGISLKPSGLNDSTIVLEMTPGMDITFQRKPG